MILKGMSGQRYQTESKAFSSGGEGDVYGLVGVNDKIVKIYHLDRIDNELEEKLKVMVKRPPSSTVLSQVAWPLDTVYNDKGSFCGFVMPRLSITAELGEIYAYPPRTDTTYKQKLILAQNICVAISEVHKAGYVFGDFNPRNIGINTNTGTVAFLDTDSYHITDGNKTYRCKVCKDDYVAPELLRKCEAYKKDSYARAPLPTFTKETDNFALAIHIFKLLMNGFTPFNGIKETERASTASPGEGSQAIKRDAYCFKPGNKHMSAAVPSLDVLTAEIADLFTRAFMYGRVDPKERPSAIEWYKALEYYESSLVQCSKDKAHLYRKGLNSCPWCEADERYRVAIVPQLKQKEFASPIQPISIANNNRAGRGVIATPQYSSTFSAQANANNIQAVTTAPKKAVKASESKHIIIKLIFIFSLLLLVMVTWWTLAFTKNTNYHGDFTRWIENAGIKIAISWLLIGASYGLNAEKGFKFDHTGDGGYVFVGYILYALVYTGLFVKYTADFGAIIALPFLFLGLFFAAILVYIIISKINSLFK